MYRSAKFAAAYTAVLAALAFWGLGLERGPRPPLSARAQADREASAAVARDFGTDGADLVLMVENAGRGDLFDREAARALRGVLAAVRDLAEVRAALAFDQVPAVGFAGLVGKGLLPGEEADEDGLRAARRRVADHPLVTGHLVSTDARKALVFVVPAEASPGSKQAAAAAIEAAARVATEGSPLRARLLGKVPVDLSREATLNSEQVRFLIIGITLSIVLAWILFRGIGPMLLVVTPVAFGVFLTLGLLGFTRVEMGGLSQVVMPVLLMLIGFTNAAHLALGIRRECSMGLARREAVWAAQRKLAAPCFLSAVTTAAGFGSLLIAEASIIRDFGRDCALGTLLTFASVMLLVPQLALTRLGRRLCEEPRPAGDAGREPLLQNLAERAAAAILDRAGAVVGIAVLGTAGCVWLASSLRPDINVRSQLPDGSEVAAGMVAADGAFGGIQPVRIAVSWGEGVGGDPFEVIREVEKAVEREPLLAPPLSVSNLVAMASSFSQWFTDPDRILKEFPPEQVGKLYRPDLRRALVVSRAQDLGVATYAPAYDRLEARLAELAEAHPGFAFRLTGEGVDLNRYLHRMVTDMALSLSVAALAILLVITVAYRSLRVGLIAVLPNLFPLFACAAGLAALGKPLSMEIVCAFSICLGIAADDSIHFLSRYRAGLESGMTVADALVGAFVRVGHVLLVTTVIMVAGMGSILFSELPMFRNFAMITCSALAAALLADLVVLPALLKLFADRSGRACGAPRPPAHPPAHPPAGSG